MTRLLKSRTKISCFRHVAFLLRADDEGFEGLKHAVVVAVSDAKHCR